MTAIGCVVCCALIVGAGEVTRAGDGQTVQMARLGPAGAEIRGDQAPRPLGRDDLARYREIFAEQEKGHWQRADLLIARLRDRVLLGHVLAQRYLHPTAYVSRYGELKDWLEHYADHPDAARIHRLALRRRPQGAAAPREPVPGYLNGAGQEIVEILPPLPPGRERSAEEEARAEALRAAIAAHLAKDEPDQAAAELRRPQTGGLLDPLEQDLLRLEVAGALMAAGRLGDAFREAAAAAERSGRVEPQLHWTAGLIAWRLDRHEQAGRHFMMLANAERATSHEVARAAFFAARAHLVTGKPHLVSRFLRIAARAGHDFYALLAGAVLGEELSFQWHADDLEGGALAALAGVAGARRAMALGQLGRHEDAEREIRKLAARARPRVVEALIALAERLDLPAAQMRLAVRLGKTDGRRRHAALFPLPSWQPEAGFGLDRALVYAFMRAESGFDPQAASHAGAHGLMQLMPATAKEVALRDNIDLPDLQALFEPSTNVALGEAYLQRLLATETVGGDLIGLAVAYNAGVARLGRWKRAIDHQGDPLLFIESLPLAETRTHVKKVLANFWIYRARLGQRSPSLSALAANEWPRYVGLEARSRLSNGDYRPEAPLPTLKPRGDDGLRYADAR